MSTLADFQVKGNNPAALFSLKIHRGDGMLLLAMNWKGDEPPQDFVGFAIEYKEPGGDRFFALKNRLSFLGPQGKINTALLSTRFSPIQKFRWVHFPRNAELKGDFTYRVTPVFMNNQDELSYGEFQEAKIRLMRETYPKELNVAFTRGYVSSQAFADKFLLDKNSMKTLLPATAAEGVKFKCTHKFANEALTWMGFEARTVLLELLDKAIADNDSKVDVIAYDLCEPAFINKLRALGNRLRILIDDDGDHGEDGSGENQAEDILVKSAGRNNVKRQHMGGLQHNKMIIVYGGNIHAAVGGSTNFSWRGFFVQNNNAVIVSGKDAIKPFQDAFASYWINLNQAAIFGATASANFTKINCPSIDIQVTFSPHSNDNAVLQKIADDVETAQSTVFFSLAFLYQTPGAMRDAFRKIVQDDDIFMFGISDKEVTVPKKKGKKKSKTPAKIDLLTPDGKKTVVAPSALNKKTAPEPFKSESAGGNGARLHHKFVVIDFDKPTARVYLGSYNFSKAADSDNGENLFLVKDQRIATSYMVEALRIFDHYQFRLLQGNPKTAKKKLHLLKPPRKKTEKTWFEEDYKDPRKIKDRVVFA